MTIRRLVFICLCVLLLSACTGLFFFPQNHLLRTPAQLNLAYEDIYFDTIDRVRLHGWWLPAPTDALATVVFLHGNAENISTHIASVAWLPAARFNVFLFDYRGYGLSQGVADLDGLHRDVEAALAMVIQRDDASPNLILFGQSLGASLAVTSLAASDYQNAVRALVIDSGFTSFRNIAREKLANFWLTWAFQWPLSLGFSNTYQPLEAIARISPIPVLIIHGTADQIIPVHHARQLYAAAKQPKQLWLVPDSQHIQSLKRATIRQRFLDYLRACLDKSLSIKQIFTRKKKLSR